MHLAYFVFKCERKNWGNKERVEVIISQEMHAPYTQVFHAQLIVEILEHRNIRTIIWQILYHEELEIRLMLVHLMLELYGCDGQLLSDEPLIRRVLDEYPGRVDMEKMSSVHLSHIETSNPLDAGLSGFVIIAQSHISLHAWPEYGEVDIDICSCKEFSQEDAIAFAKAMFQTDDVETHLVVRGTRSLRPETPDPVRLETAFAIRREKKEARERSQI